MPGTSSADLLDLWERTDGLSHAERAVAYAHAADPRLSTTRFRELPIGRRDAAVLGLRWSTFGRGLDATGACPRCGEAMEFGIDVAALIPADPGELRTIEVGTESGRIRCRIPSTADLIAIQASGGGPRDLAARCFEDGATVEDLADATVELIGERLAEADPVADIRLALTCPSCGVEWAAPFDIVSVLDRELDVWARSLLRDVATLAGAFGWTEAEVLRLSLARRRRYLELATA